MNSSRDACARRAASTSGRAARPGRRGGCVVVRGRGAAARLELLVEAGHERDVVDLRRKRVRRAVSDGARERLGGCCWRGGGDGHARLGAQGARGGAGRAWLAGRPRRAAARRLRSDPATCCGDFTDDRNGSVCPAPTRPPSAPRRAAPRPVACPERLRSRRAGGAGQGHGRGGARGAGRAGRGEKARGAHVMLRLLGVAHPAGARSGEERALSAARDARAILRTRLRQRKVAPERDLSRARPAQRRAGGRRGARLGGSGVRTSTTREAPRVRKSPATRAAASAGGTA